MLDRDPWTVCLAGAPPGASPAELLVFAAQVALTAPSPGNSQPWRLRLDGEQVDLYSDPARALPVRDPEGQQRVVAGGAALGLLRVALRAVGLGETTTRWPHGPPEPSSAPELELLARVALTGSVMPTPEEMWLLQAAPKRRTHRGPLADRPVRERLLQRLRDLTGEVEAELRVLTAPAQRAALAARVDATVRAQEADAAAQAERGAWPEPGPWPFEASAGGPARGAEILAGAPVLAVITTPDDGPRAWLRAGEALIRVLLRARVDQLYASFLPAPLARAADRWALAEELAVLGDMAQTPGFVQLALRLGYGGDLPATPRRPLAEVLLAAPP